MKKIEHDKRIEEGETFVCELCNCEYEINEAYELNGDELCGDCYNDVTEECTCCGLRYEEDELVNTAEDGGVCEDCVSDNYFTCSYCGDIYRSDHEEDDGICCGCFEEHYCWCDDCGGSCFISGAYSDCDHVYCPDCADNYSRCEDCGYIYPCEDIVDGMCEDCDDGCGSDSCRDGSYIPHYHSSKRKVQKKGVGDLYFGFELEVEKGKKCNSTLKEAMEEIQEINKFDDYLFFEDDGSLSNGFEMVSNPMTWDFIQEKKSLLKTILKTCLRSGLRSYKYNSCGFHIHLSKDAFTTPHLYKFLKLIYENKDKIEMVAQRFNNCNARFDDKESEELEKILKRKAENKDNAGAGRYQAVNLENSDTIELRFYKGNLFYNSVMKNLESAKAFYEFTKLKTPKKITWNNFVKFVYENKVEYKYLHKFLEREVS